MSHAESPHREIPVAIGIVIRAGRVLVCKRPHHVELGGYWELPGGKICVGETPETTAVRELIEETGLDVVAIGRLPCVTHCYPHGRVTLTPVICYSLTGTPQPLASQECRWITPSELAAYAFPPANASLPLWIKAAILQTGHHQANLPAEGD